MMSENLTDATCLCSIGTPTTMISVVCGTLSNILILVLLCKSKMIRETTGKILCNEAVADTLLNIFTGVMVWSNSIARAIQVFGFAIVMSFSCVKAFSLMGMSITLWLAICRPFIYRIYVLPRRVTFVLAAFWLWLPVMIGCSVSEGTFYKWDNISGCAEPEYTVRNWWIGAGNFISVLVLPFTVIIVCGLKIFKKNRDKVLDMDRNLSAAREKIRLAKLTVLLFVLNVTLQVPLHVVSFLHVKKKPILGAVMLMYFLFSSAKLFLYLYTLHNFRRTALWLLCCCCNQNLAKSTKVQTVGSNSKASVRTVISECDQGKAFTTSS